MHFSNGKTAIICCLCLTLMHIGIARADICRVTPHMERLKEIADPRQSYSGVWNDGDALKGPGLTDGFTKNVPINVPAHSDVEITVIISQATIDGRSKWGLRLSDAQGDHNGLNSIVWHSYKDTETGEDEDGWPIVRTEMIGRLPFQTQRDATINIQLGSGNIKPLTYLVKTHAKRYGDHQYSNDAGTDATTALPITQNVTIHGHFLPPGGSPLTFRQGLNDAPVEVNEGRDVVIDIAENDGAPELIYWDDSDLFLLKDVEIGTPLTARILGTNLIKPPGYVPGHSLGGIFVDEDDAIDIEIMQIKCPDGGRARFETTPDASSDDEVTDGAFAWENKDDFWDMAKISDTFTAPYTGDYYVRVRRDRPPTIYDIQHPMKYSFTVGTGDPIYAFKLDAPEFKLVQKLFPEEPQIGSPIYMGFRLINLPDYVAENVVAQVQFENIETAELAKLVQNDTDECTLFKPGVFHCEFRRIAYRGHADFEFWGNLPPEGYRWHVSWASQEGTDSIGSATGTVGEDAGIHILDVATIGDRADIIYGIPSHKYPFGGVLPGPDSRTLFITGWKLPQQAGDELNLLSSDPAIEYFYMGGPESTNQLIRELYEMGWQSFRDSHGYKSQKDVPENLQGYLLRASLREGITPGLKRFSLNDTKAEWKLRFSDLSANLRFVRQKGSLDKLTSAYVPEVLYIEVIPNLDLPLDEIPITLLEHVEDQAEPKRHELIAKSYFTEDQIRRKRFITNAIVLADKPNQLPAGLAPGAHVLKVGFAGDVADISLSANIDETFREEFFGLQVNQDVPDLRLLRTPARERLVTGFVTQANDHQAGWSFKEALMVAAKCKKMPVHNWEELSSAEADRIINYVLLTFFVDKKREKNMKIGHHAAMLLMRNMFVDLLSLQSGNFDEILKDDAALLGLLKYMGDFYADMDFPINRIKVKDPVGTEIDYGLSVAYQNENFLAKEYGLKVEAIHKWRVQATREAVSKMKDETDKLIKNAKAIEDCKPRKLMKLTGNGFDVVIDRLSAKMMSLETAEGASPNQIVQQWQPDSNSNFWIHDVKPFADAVKEQRREANIDNSLILAATTFATLPMAVVDNAAISLVVFAIDVMDASATAYIEISQYLASEKELTFSRKASVVLGMGRLEEAEVNAKGFVGVLAQVGLAAGFVVNDAVGLGFQYMNQASGAPAK